MNITIFLIIFGFAIFLFLMAYFNDYGWLSILGFTIILLLSVTWIFSGGVHYQTGENKTTTFNYDVDNNNSLISTFEETKNVYSSYGGASSDERWFGLILFFASLAAIITIYIEMRGYEGE